MTTNLRMPDIGNYSNWGKMIDKRNHSKNVFSFKNYNSASKYIQMEDETGIGQKFDDFVQKFIRKENIKERSPIKNKELSKAQQNILNNSTDQKLISTQNLWKAADSHRQRSHSQASTQKSNFPNIMGLVIQKDIGKGITLGPTSTRSMQKTPRKIQAHTLSFRLTKQGFQNQNKKFFKKSKVSDVNQYYEDYGYNKDQSRLLEELEVYRQQNNPEILQQGRYDQKKVENQMVRFFPNGAAKNMRIQSDKIWQIEQVMQNVKRQKQKKMNKVMQAKEEEIYKQEMEAYEEEMKQLKQEIRQSERQRYAAMGIDLDKLEDDKKREEERQQQLKEYLIQQQNDGDGRKRKYRSKTDNKLDSTRNDRTLNGIYDIVEESVQNQSTSELQSPDTRSYYNGNRSPQTNRNNKNQDSNSQFSFMLTQIQNSDQNNNQQQIQLQQQQLQSVQESQEDDKIKKFPLINSNLGKFNKNDSKRQSFDNSSIKSITQRSNNNKKLNSSNSNNNYYGYVESRYMNDVPTSETKIKYMQKQMNVQKYRKETGLLQHISNLYDLEKQQTQEIQLQADMTQKIANYDIQKQSDNALENLKDYDMQKLDDNIQQMIAEEKEEKQKNVFYEELLKEIEKPSKQNSIQQSKKGISQRKIQLNYPLQNMPKSMQIGHDYYDTFI